MKAKEKNNYEKLQNDVAEEIGFFMKMLKAETEWLEQYIQARISACSTEQDLRELLELRTYLEKAGRDIRKQNCFRAHHKGGLTYLLYVDNHCDPERY